MAENVDVPIWGKCMPSDVWPTTVTGVTLHITSKGSRELPKKIAFLTQRKTHGELQLLSMPTYQGVGRCINRVIPERAALLLYEAAEALIVVVTRGSRGGRAVECAMVLVDEFQCLLIAGSRCHGCECR